MKKKKRGARPGPRKRAAPVTPARRSKSARLSRTGAVPKKGSGRKRKPRASRVSRPSASRGRKGSPQKRRSARGPSISRRVDEIERAVDTLGRSKRFGSIPLGKTNWVTPTKSGLRAIRSVLDSINKVNRVGKSRIFTYDLEIRYIGPDGKRRKAVRGQVGIPRLRDIRPKLGESKVSAMNRIVLDRIRREVMGILRERLKGESAPGKFQGRKISKHKAAAALRRFKRTRGVSVRLTFRRET